MPTRRKSWRSRSWEDDNIRIALYARVSKRLDQTPENQLIALRKWAQDAGHTVVGEFVDEISSRDTRPQKEAVLKMLRLGTIDGVAFTNLDRWGRDIEELVHEMIEFTPEKGRHLIAIMQGLDMSTAAGRLAANVLAAMANYERDIISERTKLGLARAKAIGKHIGRPRVHRRRGE